MADLKLAFALAVAALSVFALSVNGEYKFVKAKVTWAQAEAACVKWGGHLANINSAKENAYVYKEIRKRGMSLTWIGLNDIKCEGKWGAPAQYLNWNPQHKEPNGARRENCINMFNSNGKWNDWGCTRKATSVCQIDSGKYYYNKAKKTWSEADKDCKTKGGRLACIESASENQKIYAELKKRGFGWTWFGMDDNSCEGNWQCPRKFTNWNKGEPNGKRKENCVNMYSNIPKWNDWGCHNKASYVCQKGEGLTTSGTQWTTTTRVVYKWVPGDEENKKAEEQIEDVSEE